MLYILLAIDEGSPKTISARDTSDKAGSPCFVRKDARIIRSIIPPRDFVSSANGFSTSAVYGKLSWRTCLLKSLLTMKIKQYIQYSSWQHRYGHGGYQCHQLLTSYSTLRFDPTPTIVSMEKPRHGQHGDTSYVIHGIFDDTSKLSPDIKAKT